MTPDEPDSLQPLDPDQVASESARSRADLQAELRTSRKKEQKHRHRWRRRTLYALSSIVLIAALGAGGLYVYALYRFDQIKKIHAKHLVAEVTPGKPFNLLLVGSEMCIRDRASTSTPSTASTRSRRSMPSTW